MLYCIDRITKRVSKCASKCDNLDITERKQQHQQKEEGEQQQLQQQQLAWDTSNEEDNGEHSKNLIF